MRSVIVAALPFALICAPLQAANPDGRTPPDRAPSLMTSTEIAVFNTGLTNSHPYFIKCRKILETGSLVKKARVCRTNADWRIASSNGNDNARATVDEMRKGSVNSSN